MDLLTDRLIEHHDVAARELVHRAKRIGGMFTLAVFAAYAASLWLLLGSGSVWAALVVATLAFLVFRQIPALALALARLPDRGCPRQASLQRALDLALDERSARDVLQQMNRAVDGDRPPRPAPRGSGRDQ